MELFRRKGLVIGLLVLVGVILLGATLAIADPTDTLPPPTQPIPLPAPPQ
jgi:hypothetical protein